MKNTKNRVPWLTVFIVTANVLTFLCELYMDPAQSTGFLLHFGGMNPVLVVQQGEYHRLFTAMFLHSGWSHLGANMLLAGYLGMLLEQEFGAPRFGCVYILSGLAGSAASLLYHLQYDPDVVCLGASGAVFGLVGACLLLILRSGGSYKNIRLERILLMIAVNLSVGFSEGGIDNTAHIGGLIGGFLLALLLFSKKKQEIK